MGDPTLALSWKWSTGSTEFERHKSPAQTGSGTRAPIGAFHHLLEMPQLGESGVGGVPARSPECHPSSPSYTVRTFCSSHMRSQAECGSYTSP